MSNPTSAGRRRMAVMCVAAVTIASLAPLGKTLWLSCGGIHNLISPTYWSGYRSHGLPWLEFGYLYAINGRILKHGNPAIPEVAITIDDGPHPRSTGPILDALRKAHVHATFFVVGSQVDKLPMLAKRIVDDGNEIGNHTQHHPRLTKLTVEGMQKEITDCDTSIFRATGMHPVVFRPPGMAFNEAVLTTAKDHGYTTVSWTNADQDYVSSRFTGDFATPANTVNRALNHIGNGSILLIHDAPSTAGALPIIIDRLEKMGYRLVTVSEMLDHLPR